MNSGQRFTHGKYISLCAIKQYVAISHCSVKTNIHVNLSEMTQCNNRQQIVLS